MKTVEEVYQELLDAYRERAGYVPADSCDLSIRLYAAAAQIQALSMQSEWVLAQSFPQTAEGEYLDHHALVCGLSRMPAAKAVGKLRFLVGSTAQHDRVIEMGTVCMTGGSIRFVTTEEAVLAAGERHVDVSAEAMESGVGGNVPAGTVTVMTAYPVGITGCTNPEAFAGGMDREQDEALRQRVLKSYQRLPNGANAAWYETAALACEGVAAAAVVGRPRGIGTVDVYVTSPAGIPEEALLETVRETLNAAREIAVDVEVKAPDTLAVDVAAEIAVKDGAEFSVVADAVKAAVSGWFNGGLLGEDVKMAELGRLIYDIDGVENYHLLAPTVDMKAGERVLPVLRTLTVTEISAE